MQVDVNLSRTAADLITEFSAGAKIYLSSAANYADIVAGTGTFAAVGSGTALVSGTDRYLVTDSSGTPGTTWYKFRVGNSGGTLFTDYSDPWLSTSLTAYATLDDLVETLTLGTDTTRYNLLTDLLGDVSSDVDAICDRRFYRYPQVTGDATLYWDVTERYCDTLSHATNFRRSSIGIPRDIISVTSLWVRDDESSAYVQLTEGTDFVLRRGTFQGVAGVDVPFEDIQLMSTGLYQHFPMGINAVKIIGAFGFPKVPLFVKRATITACAERFRRTVNGGSLPEGINQFGTPMFLTGPVPDFRALSRAPYAKDWSYV